MSSSAEATDHADPSAALQDPLDEHQAGPSAALPNPIDELVNTRVHVVWTPADAHADTPSTISTLALFLHIQYNAALSLASVRLQLRNVAIKKGAKKSFYLLIPLERIGTLSLGNTEFSTLINNDVYRLYTTLTEPLDLVGPRCHGYETGWPGGKGDMKQLRSLAQALRFTLLIPTAAVTKSRLLDFCAAVTRPEGLGSLPRQYNHQRLYNSTGGYVYPVQRKSVTASSPATAPSPASDTSTVPVDTPPEYHSHTPSPGYSNPETSPARAKTSGKRRSSRDPDSRPPPKRRGGDLPAFPADLPPSATTQLRSDWHQEAELLLRTQPGLGDLVHVLHSQIQVIEQLRGEVDELRQSHTDLAKRYADLETGHADLAKTNAELQAQMDQQASVFHDDLQRVERAVEDWKPNLRNTRDKVELELRSLVSGIVDGIFEDVEDLPEGVEGAINYRVSQAVESRFSALKYKIRQAFEVDE